MAGVRLTHARQGERRRPDILRHRRLRRQARPRHLRLARRHRARIEGGDGASARGDRTLSPALTRRPPPRNARTRLSRPTFDAPTQHRLPLPPPPLAPSQGDASLGDGKTEPGAPPGSDRPGGDTGNGPDKPSTAASPGADETEQGAPLDTNDTGLSRLPLNSPVHTSDSTSGIVVGAVGGERLGAWSRKAEFHSAISQRSAKHSSSRIGLAVIEATVQKLKIDANQII